MKRRGPNGLKLEKETTLMEVRWTQVDGVTLHDGTPRSHLLERELEQDEDAVEDHLDDVRRVFIGHNFLDVLRFYRGNRFVGLCGASWSVSGRSRGAWTLVRSRRRRRGGVTSR